MRRAERKKSGERSGVHILNESFHVFSKKSDFPTCQEKEERDEKQDDQGEDQKEAHNELLEVKEESPSSHLSSLPSR